MGGSVVFLSAFFRDPIMSRRVLCLVALTALAAGCGESLPSTPIERGAALVHYGRYGEAINAYTEAIQLKPQDAQAYLLRGRAYHARNEPGDLDAAVADFTTGIGLAPKDSELLYNRSMAYRDLGDEEKSHEDAEAARRLIARSPRRIRRCRSRARLPRSTPMRLPPKPARPR